MKKLFLTIVLVIVAMAQMTAQDLIVPKHGDPITAYNVEESGKFFFYTVEQGEDSPILRIAKDSVLMIRMADGTVLDARTAKPAAATSNEEIVVDSPEIAEEDIHGSLIAQGNCVFIPTNSLYDFERAGQERFKELIKEWGYWKVVEKPEQAHFILQFTTQLEDTDYCWVLIRPRAFYRQAPEVSRNGWNGKWRQAELGITAMACRGSEDPEDNRMAASLLAGTFKKIMTDPSCSESRRFYKHHRQSLDADAVKKNSTDRVVML